MYRGLTNFRCVSCGHIFTSHNIEYNMRALSVPQRCPQCKSIRTLPSLDDDMIPVYEPIWEEMEEAQREEEERRLRAEEKKKANEERQRKQQAKKRQHLTRKQKEAYDKKQAKKAAKRGRTTTVNELPQQDEIIIAGPTFFPPGTPLKIEK